MVNYATDDAAFLAGGKQDISTMLEILSNASISLAPAERILEFGCASARMIRHLVGKTRAELWGTDISAQHIQWCIQNLSPTIHFATTTLAPHLPFEDCFFNFIFCGSVFTHIEDVAETWLLELGRVLRRGGHLYLTIHDENTVRLLDTQHRDHWLSKQMNGHPTYASHKNDFDLIVTGRGVASQVFYNSEYFQSLCPPVFRWLSLTPAAYNYQSAVLLEKI